MQTHLLVYYRRFFEDPQKLGLGLLSDIRLS